MIKNYSNLVELFKKYNIEWFLNITEVKSKDLDYSPLHDEISIDSDENISTKVVIIKNNKKASFSIDWFSQEKIELAIQDLLSVIEYWEFDKDILLPNIHDSLTKDFSNQELNIINFDYLESQFTNFKKYNFNEFIKIESFSIWYKEIIHTYVNSNGSIKTQIDNSSFYFFELFADNWINRESDYEYKTFKTFPIVKNDSIKKLEEKLLNKIIINDNKIDSWVYNITLQNDVVANFIEIILDNLWAETIREWLSLFSKNSIWEKIFSEKFTLINNPDLDWYTWNLVFDWEWVTQKTTTLFERWVFSNKFYDYKNSIKEWVLDLWCSTVSNIELKWDFSSCFLDNSDFLFTNLMAFHTVDTTTWKFSLSWEWYIIKNWIKKDFIKNISLTWDIINLFSNIHVIWDDFLDYWNFKIPSITFLNQKVV